MCQKRAGLHSCGHTGPVNTEVCSEATLRLDPALRNRDAAKFDAACDVSTQTDARDYCCKRICCSQQIKTTYDAYRKAGAAKADFPDPGFWQRNILGQPSASYLAKKEWARVAYLQAQVDHNTAKEKHGICRQRQDAVSATTRAATDKGKGRAVSQDSVATLYQYRREREQQHRLEREMRIRFGESAEPVGRRDSYFAETPTRRVDAYFSEVPKRRQPPPPPPPIMSYGVRQRGHEYVREWLPSVEPGSWSESSRGRPPSCSTLNTFAASASSASATQFRSSNGRPRWSVHG